MIYLYDSTETDFRYNGKPLPNSYDVTVHYTLNGEYYVNGKYPLDNKNTYKEIIEDRIVKIHTMDGMQPFRIVNVSKHELYVELEAWPLFYADMRNKLVKPLTLRGVNGQAALNAFVNNLLIDTPFNFYSDITGTHDYHTQDEDERENNPKQLYNALDILKDIANRWGGELWVRGYDIRINNRIGTDTEAMLYEKKNISEFVDTTNIEGIVTRLHGISEWTGEREEGQDEAPEHRIETTIDSPLINNYSGVIFEKQYRNNDARTKKELEDWLRLKFTTENIDKPQRTIEVGTHIVDGTSIKIGDTLVLKYVKHDADMRIKVVGYEYDGFADKVIRVILGEPKSTSSSTIGNTITDLVNDIVSPVDRKSTIAMNSADGKNTVFHGTADPNTLNLKAQENDTYFRTNGIEKEIWRFTGTLWELIMDTSETTKNAQEIESVIEQAQTDRTALEEEINQTYEDAVAEADRLAAIRDNGITIEAGQIIAGTIDTARLDAVSIVTSGLSADVVKANHIQADDALFDKLFTSTLATDRLSAQEAWIKNINIADASIDGAKIQDATIGSAKIANLDVSKISGDTSEFVQSNWNDYAGGNVRITGSGIVTTASDSSQTYIQNGIVGTRNPDGATIGQIGYIDDSGSPSYTISTTWGSHFKVRQFRSGTLRDSFYLQSGGYDGYINTNRFEFTGNQGVHFYNQLTLQNDLNANNYNIYGAYDVQLAHGGYLRTTAAGQTRLSSSGGMLQLGVSGSWKLNMDSTYLYAHVNLSMEGNDITNQSDERLKTNILDHRESSLDKISRFNFVDFTWLKNDREDFGVIAQQVQKVAPELILEGTNGYLSVNNSLLNMMTTHAVQQLAHKHDTVTQTVDNHTDDIHKLQQELSKANRRIEELEGAI